MRRYFTAYIIIASLIATISVAQQRKPLNPNGFNQAAPALPSGDFGAPSKAVKGNQKFPSDPLSTLAAVTGANPLPISTKWDNQTNGRSLHTLVRDPDDAKKLHFIAMIAEDNSSDDTIGGKYPSRRVAYTYSSDGGVTWTPQVIIDNIRLGYPDIILYKRGSVNVPIIAAHNGPNSESDNTDWTTKIYIEQGNPGTGNFKMYSTDRTSSTGALKDIGYPSLGLSLNQDTLYLLGCILPPTGSQNENLQFGKFALDASRAANWLGWKNRPGGLSSRGRVVSGKDLLRVAPNGKLGVLWSSDSNYVCYVESTDAGETWTKKYINLYQPPTKSILASDNKTYDCEFAGCSGGLDFWFDQSNTPHFLWQAFWISKSGTYFPLNSTGIFSWKMGETAVNLITVFNDPGITDMVMFDTINATVNTLNPVGYFTGSDNPSTPHATVLWSATPLLTTDPNNWMVFYETYQDGDAIADVDIFNDGSVYQTKLFRNIYSVKTTDGGNSWSAPTPFHANDPNSDPSLKFDFHFPSTPTFNLTIAGKISGDVNFVADTFPGAMETGMAGWENNNNTWYHDNAIKSGVALRGNVRNDILSQNYPNPFISSTTIPVVMKNDETVTLTVTDILGREVATLFHGRLSAGGHNIPFAASNFGAGVYTYTLKTSTGSVSRTMSVVK